MRHATSVLALAAVALAGLSAVALRATDQREPTAAERAAAPVRALLSARPFALALPTTHTWRAQQPGYDAGWLVVLAVDPVYAAPRALEEPVLYAGAETVERVNFGAETGHLVCIVPSAHDGAGGPELDLATVPFFFGAEELPERVDAREAARQLEQAVRRGARPFPADEIALARARGGGLVRLAAREELDELAALLVLEHAPEDQDVGTGMLAPRPR